MNDVIAKLDELKRLDRECVIFGASAHRYETNRSLSESDISAVETRYHCRFPDEYKQFLTQVGNGGAGPFWGLFPLEMQDDGHELGLWSEGGLIGKLDVPFALAGAWNLPEEDLMRLSEPDEAESEEENEALWEALEEELESKYWASEIMNGAIPICHQGCALRTWLVVTGPAKGTVWDDDRADYGGITPLMDSDGEPLTFKKWYLSWLDAGIEEVSVGDD